MFVPQFVSFCHSVSSTVHYDFFVFAEQTLNKPIMYVCVCVVASFVTYSSVPWKKTANTKNQQPECQSGMSSTFWNWHESNWELIRRWSLICLCSIMLLNHYHIACIKFRRISLNHSIVGCAAVLIKYLHYIKIPLHHWRLGSSFFFFFVLFRLIRIDFFFVG